MIVIRWVRWLKGWVEFSISKENSNRFLSLAGKDMWNVRVEKGVLIGHCYAKEYLMLARKAKQSRCKISILKRAGYPFWQYRYRFRLGLFIGAAIFLLFLAASTFFIWSIDVEGNLLLSDEQILKEASSLGLHEGALRFSVNLNEVEYSLRQKFPEIAWISINRSGTHFDIAISEATPKPQIQSDETPCNVVSKCDAVVRSIEAYRGTAMVKPGDVVSQNDLLVSGIKEFENSEVVHYTHASAKVIGEREKTLDYQLPLTFSYSRPSGGTKEKKKMRLFGFEIPLYVTGAPKEFSDCHVSSRQMHFLWFDLPIYIETTTYDLMETVQVNNDKDAVRRALANQAKEDEPHQFPGAKILQRRYQFEETDGGMTLHATYRTEEEIGVQIPIVSQENQP